MKRASRTIGCLLVAGCLGAWIAAPVQDSPTTPPERPPGHPPTNLPPGHPPTRPTTPAEPEGGPAAPDPADIGTVDAVVAAYYGTISGPAAAPRDWDRFRSLFMPGARFVTTRRGRQGTRPGTMTPDEFIALNGRYFEQTGYDERQIACRVDTYGTIAHALSTYEARRNAGDAAPYARGLNSIQLVHDGQRWWIASVMWEYERPGGDPLPERYLPGASPDPG